MLAREFADLAVTLFSVASVEEALERLTATAVAVLPGCDAASVTLSDGRRHWTPVATDDLAVRFDAAQYDLGHGPCLEALHTPLVAAEDGNWDRWPGLGAAVADLPFTTVVSCGLFAVSQEGEPGGALNLYGRKDNFDADTKELALVLAAHGAVALETQRERTRATTIESQLQDALMSRDVIGQAKGILMARQGLSPEKAFDVLRRASQRLNVKLRELAGQLTESVVDSGQAEVPYGIVPALNEILERAALLPPDRLPDLARSVARDRGARMCRIWLVDYAQRQLVLFGDPGGEAVNVEGTVAGRAFTLSQPVEVPDPDGVTFWVPLKDGIDRLGVVQFEVERLDGERRAALVTVAALLAREVVTRGRYTDAMVLARRTDDIPLASEMLWGTLAPQSFATHQVTVAVAVEPAYGVAGDGYDYAYNEGIVHAAVFDAIGHDIEATIIGNLAIGAYRHARRRRRDLAETGAIIDRIIQERFEDGKYATGVLAELDVSTGVLQWVNFGHPSPMLIRHNRVVGPLDGHRHVPLGLSDLNGGGATQPNQVHVEPGDRLLLYTDGLVEARTSNGTSFGVDRLQDFLDRALASGLLSSEVVRRLAHAVVDHHGGTLKDDATTLMIHWHP